MSEAFKSVMLFGAPGVGKGTQGKILGAIPGFYHTACGDLFRSIDRESELGRVFAQYSSRGELVPDDVTVRMWRSAIGDRVRDGFYTPDRDLLILDGIPRTVEQAGIMDGLIEVLAIVHLVCPNPEPMFERMRLRALKENRADDADPDVIRNRWSVYERETAPVLEHYDRGLILEIDALGTPAQVLRRVLEKLEPVHSAHFDVD